jgi:hypothetical protein
MFLLQAIIIVANIFFIVTDLLLFLAPIKVGK